MLQSYSYQDAPKRNCEQGLHRKILPYMPVPTEKKDLMIHPLERFNMICLPKESLPVA